MPSWPCLSLMCRIRGSCKKLLLHFTHSLEHGHLRVFRGPSNPSDASTPVNHFISPFFFTPLFSFYDGAMRSSPDGDTTPQLLMARAGFASLIFPQTGTQVIHPLQECLSYHSPASPSRADGFLPPQLLLWSCSTTARQVVPCTKSPKPSSLPEIEQRAAPGPGVLGGLIQQGKSSCVTPLGSQIASSHHQPPRPHNLFFFFLCIFLAFPNVFFLALRFSRKAA